MKQKLNFVIIGCGNIGHRHAYAIAQYANLIAVCDNNMIAAEKLAQQYNCKAESDLSRLLDKNSNIDIVSICTPNWLHATQSIECMKKGFHVLCEKPMAISSVDAQQMTRVSEITNKKLFIVKQLRYYPNLIYLKQLIKDGMLKNIKGFEIKCFWNRDENYYKDWRGLIKTDGGTLYTQFSHYIDLLIWLFGEMNNFEFTCANSQHPYIEFEDFGSINLELKTGIRGSFSYSVNAGKENIENSLTIFTSKGNLKLSGGYLEVIDNTIDNINFPKLNTDVDKLKSHFKVYEEVIASIQGKANTATMGKDSIQSVQLIEAIYNSIPT